MAIDKLEDEDYPAWTMGQAADALDVQPAFLRSLDAADVVQPHRSSGGHRRYSRRQLRLAARLRELFDDGMTLAAAERIVRLEDQLAETRAENAELRRRLGEPTDPTETELEA
ncbi:DNA-binding transcriptional MerR regulator [Amycolatopsis viridis]|uniref:DNA-binding transcriptional MerR regulator n=2 Tax=Amycolatopsis viridis TaxID=185678 RepID=A0ABX0SW69_9PSEU|nr:DNA-binding transcriptional MerR regulator [Amycolatopsis viridis]